MTFPGTSAESEQAEFPPDIFLYLEPHPSIHLFLDCLEWATENPEGIKDKDAGLVQNGVTELKRKDVEVLMLVP